MSRVTKLIDCYTPLRPEDCVALKDLGYAGVCRYLGAKSQGWGKGLTPTEVLSIQHAGLSIVSIWEGNPTSAAYFTVAQGHRDAKDALTDANWVGQPEGSAIYWTVDYDAQDGDLSAIVDYFTSVREAIGSRYKVGAYGSARVIEALSNSHAKPDFLWQTLAWSEGVVSPLATLYQSEVAQSLAGINVDIDAAYRSPGWWPDKDVGLTLQYGDRGDDVKTLQCALNSALSIHIAEDGVYGSVTDSAVKTFQVMFRLPVTGIADETTQSAIRQQIGTQAHQRQASVDQRREQQIARATSLLTQVQDIIKSL